MRMDANPFAGLPVVVKNLLIINVLLFLVKVTGLGNWGGSDMDTHLGLHYFLNMLGLYMLAPPLEYKWGSQRFLTFYMITGVGAALFYSGAHYFDHMELRTLLSQEQYEQVLLEGGELWAGGRNYVDVDMGRLNALLNTPMVGASGAIYGVLLAFGMTFPNVELMVFPLFIPIKAKYFVLIYGAITIYMSLQRDPDDNVAHLAHLGGMVVGYVLIQLWRHRGQ
jgi:membrane associated rhomboid family serine protease